MHKLFHISPCVLPLSTSTFSSLAFFKNSSASKMTNLPSPFTTNNFMQEPPSSNFGGVHKALNFSSTICCHSCTFFDKSLRSASKMTNLPSSVTTNKFMQVPSCSNSGVVHKVVNFSTICCRSCTCSVVSLKGCNVIGQRIGWFGTISGGDEMCRDSFSVGAGEEGELSNDVTEPNQTEPYPARWGELSSDDDENVVGSGKVGRVQRRQRGGGDGGVAVAGNPDLLTIPGVGPRNLRKLVEKGFDGVDQLKQFYKDKFFRQSTQKMVEYLQSSVGIIHKNHAESITSFIKQSVDKELKDDSSDSVLSASLKKRITLCVEGNISVGKTTFLQRIANETLELQDLVEVVPEPIDKWQNIGADHFNILDAFYAEPERYAYTFQNYVFVTRVMQERESSGGLKPLRLMERSIFTDRMVFVRAVHEAKWMSEMEISIYDSWFDPVVSCLPGLIPDGFIYLRASPDTCHKRMLTRKREEEGGVSLEYLRDLHEKHESWLFPSESGNRDVLSVSKLADNLDGALHPEIRDRVFYLEGTHMHPSIQKVPALVLNCEPNIDFNKDIDAKRQYALQVAKFFEFVKKKKEATTSDGTMDDLKSNQEQVLTPHTGGLWMPGAANFPESALKSLDLKKAMSYMSPMSR